MFRMKRTTQRVKSMVFGFTAMTALSLVGTASATTTYSSLQKSMWSSCTTCAGKNGSGPTASHSQTINVGSPSLTGASSKFSISGSRAFANALWWKQLGANSSAHNFTYDLYFYMKNPGAAQALEFDVNQSVGGHKYVFGTECDIRGSGTWRVWSAGSSWVSTGVPCRAPSAFTWHHYTLQVQRTTSNQARFVSITLDGRTSYVNRTFSTQSSGVSELNVAFQMDGNSSMTGYDVWLDKVSLTAW